MCNRMLILLGPEGVYRPAPTTWQCPCWRETAVLRSQLCSRGGGSRMEQQAAGGAEAGKAERHRHVEAPLHHCRSARQGWKMWTRLHKRKK